LQRAKPNLELKWIRKLVNLDLNRISDEAWEMHENEEKTERIL